MKTVAIIQARMGSTRLPGKSLLPLAGEPMLYRIIERVKRCETLDEIVLATTELREDDALVVEAQIAGIKCYRGSENDLVDRIFKCALAYGADIIVRICADNPFIEPSEVDRIVKEFLNYDDQVFLDEKLLFSNTQEIDNNGYPDGIGAEVYDTDTFKWLYKELTSEEYREHPHLVFYNTGYVKTCQCPKEHRSNAKIDVNTKEEYKYAKKVYDYFGHNNFAYKDYVEKMNGDSMGRN